jgi:hypothetical protein
MKQACTSPICVYLRSSADKLSLFLALIAIGCHRASTSAPPAAVAFSDRAREAGIRFIHDNGHRGPYYYPEMIGGGCGLIDADGDGWLDLFLPQGALLPSCAVGAHAEQFSDRLYRNNRDGTFTDVTRKAGVSGIVAGKKAYSIGCAVGDIDNDGDDDLLVTTYGRCLLYRNRGESAGGAASAARAPGTFTEVARQAGITRDGFWTSAAFFDADGDGFLDLFVCNYIRYQPGDDVACGTSQTQRDYCPPGFFPPSRSAFYRNNGDGTFADETTRAGFTSPFNKALGVVTSDFDADGDQDVFVACDLTPKLLYLNEGRLRFREAALERGVAFNEAGQPQASMGVDWRDYDGDLRPDLLVTNYWFENTNLFQSRDSGIFSEESFSAGLGAATLQRVGWGTALLDFDNDGRRDTFSHNGHVMLYPDRTTPGARAKQRDQLFLQRPPGHFEEASARAGPWFQEEHMGRGAAFGDIDNDGDIDILAAQINAPPAVLVNETRGGHWLTLQLIGTRSNRSAIGARVRVTAAGVTQIDEVRSAYSYAAANDLRLHFGLGAATHVDRIEVRWPSGRETLQTDVAADQALTIVE